MNYFIFNIIYFRTNKRLPRLLISHTISTTKTQQQRDAEIKHTDAQFQFHEIPDVFREGRGGLPRRETERQTDIDRQRQIDK